VLEFQGSFTQQTTEYLELTNNSNTPLAFKVKTTAPKLYCVRPNAGLIHPNESAEISIILQGFAQPLPSDYKCKDKFLIVSLPAPDVKDASRVSDQWSQLESRHGNKMVSRKVKVNYFVTDDDRSTDDRSQDDYEDRSRNGGHNGYAAAGAGAGAAAAVGAAGAAAVSRRNGGDSNGSSHQNGNSSKQRSRDYQQYDNEPEIQQRSTPQNAEPSYQAPAPVVNQQQYQQQPAATNDYQPQKVIATEPVQGISIQLAALLILLAFLAGWLLF
jgi:hypothetical protein